MIGFLFGWIYGRQARLERQLGAMPQPPPRQTLGSSVEDMVNVAFWGTVLALLITAAVILVVLWVLPDSSV